MKKTTKKRIIICAVILLGILALLAAVVFFIITQKTKSTSQIPTQEQIIEQATQLPHVQYDEQSGMLYMDNAVIVIFKEGTEKKAVEALAKNQGASLETQMEKYGIYRFRFEKITGIEQLNEKIEELSKKDAVEKAYLDYCFEKQKDINEEPEQKTFQEKEAVYPDSDEFDGDAWDVNVPRGKNWGMEAIKAPGAWAYLEDLEEVNVGLIDAMPDASHPDLKNMLKKTTIQGITEDGSVYEYTEEIEPEDHGTHVSGTIAAEWNGSGVAGVVGDKGNLYYAYTGFVYEAEEYDTSYSYMVSINTLLEDDVRAINISQHTGRLRAFAASRGNETAIREVQTLASSVSDMLVRVIHTRQEENLPDFVICQSAGNVNNIPYYPDKNAKYGYREEPDFWQSVRGIFGYQGEMGDVDTRYNNFLAFADEPEVKDRIIVVGSAGIDKAKSSATKTYYKYSNFSNIGARVDVTAPGEDIYSSKVNGYMYDGGTSMATPHVTGVAGLVFAANPSLSGPEVKQIITSSTYTRFFYTGGSSGMLNAKHAVESALQTKKTSVKRVLHKGTHDGLDLCFVVDTTSSMQDDIDDACENMETILRHLSEKTENYRVALVDYRDFPERTSEKDYPARVELDFSDDNQKITDAINALTLGDGGDTEETVYSGLMKATELSWRTEAKKVIIILGDAPPLDPEPNTNYTFEKVLAELTAADIKVDRDESDHRVIGEMEDSMINVYSVLTGGSSDSDAATFFEDIAKGTGGSFSDVDDASQVGEAISDSIDQIEFVENIDVRIDFGTAMADESVDFYDEDDVYAFSVTTNKTGEIRLDGVVPGTYTWKSNGIYPTGSVEIDGKEDKVQAQTGDTYRFTGVLSAWQNYRIWFIIGGVLIIAFAVAIPIGTNKFLEYRRTHRKEKPGIPPERKEKRVWMQPPQEKTPPVRSKPAQPPAAGASVEYCPMCGTRMQAGSRFCGKCGKQLH